MMGQTKLPRQKKRLLKIQACFPNRNEVIALYNRHGYATIPLDGKCPTSTGWQKTEPDDKLIPATLPGNYGLVLKDQHVVIDVDPRNFPKNESSFQKLVKVTGPLLDTFIVKTGGGGVHIYFKKPKGLHIKRQLSEFPGIEFKSSGQQVVGPFSIHPDSKQTYRIQHLSISRIAEAPSKLLDLIKYSKANSATLPKLDQKFLDDPEAVERFRFYLMEIADPAKEGNRDNVAYSTAAKGKDEGLSPQVVFDLMAEYWWPGCEQPFSLETVKNKVMNAFKYGSNPIGINHPKNMFEEVKHDVKTLKLAWDVSKDGANKKTLNNCRNYFRLPDFGMTNILKYNDFSYDIEFTGKAPWHTRGFSSKLWDSGEAILCKDYLSSKYKFDISVNILDEAAFATANENRYHPLRQYLDNLAWDGVLRLDTWLSYYLGTPQNSYVRLAGRKTLVAAVARAYSPGVKFDYVLILEGAQGIRKSTAVDVLGGEYYGDMIIDAHSKDTVDAMRGKWIMEIGEMECARRSETQALKQFFSRRTDRTRLAYGKGAKDYPRSCIFIGTTNPEADGYLKDQTGNRRYWPVETSKILIDKLVQDRDQLFAEAKHYWKQGEALYLDEALADEEAKKASESRRQKDPWTEIIAGYVNTEFEGVYQHKFVSKEIYQRALNGNIRSFSRADSARISNIFVFELGWSKKSIRHVLYGGTTGFVRPAEEQHYLDRSTKQFSKIKSVLC